MSYQPVIPMGGNAGWSFLQRTREVQQAAFENSPKIVRDVDYFRENIGKVKTAEDLVGDRRLLSVALGAFGLDADIDSKFFVKKVLAEGTIADDSLANKLSDARYKALAGAFGFDLDPPRTQVSSFADKIVDAYQERQFEVAVGDQDANMRLALGFEREFSELLKGEKSENALWFTLMATPPLRKVFEKAFALPTSVGTLDIDRQLEIFKEKSRALVGRESPRKFAEPDAQKELTRLFLVRSELEATGPLHSAGSVALSLLQSMPRPSLLG